MTVRLEWERFKLAVSEWWVVIRHGLICGRHRTYVEPETWGDATMVRCTRCGIVLGEVA